MSKFYNFDEGITGYFWRDQLTTKIINSIKNSPYKLPLKDSEINTIINQAKSYSKKYYEFDEDDYPATVFRFKMISIILNDFNYCNKKTQELIALGLVGLMHVDQKYIKMYYYHRTYLPYYENLYERENYLEDSYDDDDYDDDGYGDYLYAKAEENEKYELDFYLNKDLNKYDSIYSRYYNSDIPKDKQLGYIDKAEAFNKLSRLIKKELEYSSKHNYSKDLKHFKMLISLYKKVQKEVYKQELKELIRSDLYFCHTYTIDIVKDVTILYEKDFFELDCKNFYDLLKMLQDEFDLYLKEKELYESNKSKNK